MCPKVLEKPKRARKGVTLSVKLDIIKRLDRGERNKDIVRALNLPASTIRTIYTQRERILKAADVGSASSKVVSFSRHPVMDKMESLLLEWIDGCRKCGVPLSYLTLKEKSVSLFNKLKQKALDDGDESVAKVEFKGSHGWFDRFLRRGQLHSLKVTGESASADTEAAEKFPEELTDEELMQLKEERITIKTECNNEQPESEVIRELNVKHLSEIFAKVDRAAMIAEKYDFNFERACRFRAGLQDVLSAYKELYDRKMCEAKQSSILSFFKPSTSATAEDEPGPSTSRRAAIEEGVDARDMHALMNSDDDEMTSQSPVPPTTPASDDSA
ncbi:tigger transposable element-derived protein 1-like [Hypanus sabinus]|uniref:tigger transposable element-derived protein 1-like n=1 Tax=Hypanus sabinus TaxID=79690 RepID=UPI0028C38716|nr:tigger transposable element-derived protein 1-like [Hypanus sabinus]XP_059839914.1 tigger transposable element-derived protein 1-like [Hypanus sabinus]XP_059839923.1 tigger transposable element-derived protein 1-like [Hypanus sabinus]XP_059839938.1 tigger transposable element-derived protein 1-like [Hypanus sabinus]